MNVRGELESRITAAMSAAGAGEDAEALVAPAARPEFGHYQANGIMPAAKGMKTNPRELAAGVVEHADLSDLAEKVEIAGPGFINITLKDSFLAGQLGRDLSDERLGADKPAGTQKVVVDYSGPNLAKEMHVGHLRSTIIGDALARILAFQGHEVIRQNHVGDWGTQFGMLIAYMDRLAGQGHPPAEQLSDLEQFYQQAKRLFDEDTDFADTARNYVVRLQSGDEYCLGRWREFLAQSMAHCREVYERLGVSLSDDDVRGESAYNDDLPQVVAGLEKAGLLKESQGARCVFLEQFTDADGNTLPVIVQKSDGGYLYATTDLAAVRYRADELQADRILYVTDSRQALHFRQVFAVARAAGFAPESVSLEHVAFGMMLGEGGRPFKTREGGTVKLADLLDESVSRAKELLEQKNPNLPGEEKNEISRVVGVGALKYADLAQNRASDYVFSWEKMLSLDGNTAPYMQYAYARIRSIFRKGGMNSDEAIPTNRDEPEIVPAGITIKHESERALAVKLIRFPETIEMVADQCTPHVLCTYLFDLAGAFTTFYENCPVLKADEPTRASRLALCRLAARTIKTGLSLLGIRTIERM